jgi:hypothetical protein
MPSRLSDWTAAKNAASREASSRSGATSPSSPWTSAYADPPMRFLPAPRSSSRSSVSPAWVASSGVNVARTSVTGAKAETMRDRGAVTDFSSPEAGSRQVVRIDMESLPTGIATPSAGQSSMPTARTVSKSFASSPGWPAAHIQLAESFTSPMAAIGAAAILVSASPTAMRPDAGPSMRASGVRSPMAMASPRYVE